MSQRNGYGTVGNDNDHIGQNQIVVKAVLNTALLLKNKKGITGKEGVYPRADHDITSMISVHDFVVTPTKDSTRSLGSENILPLVHSCFNGEGAEAKQAFPNDEQLQIKKILHAYRPFGVSYDKALTVNPKDILMPKSVGVIVAGSVTIPAHQVMYPGEVVCLTLPKPREKIYRFARDAPDAVKLIPGPSVTKTTVSLISDEMRKYVLDLQKDASTRSDTEANRIDPSRELFKNVADALVMFGLEFMNLLLDKQIISISVLSKDETNPDNKVFKFHSGKDDENIIGTQIATVRDYSLFGLSRAFGLMNKSTPRGNAYTFPANTKKAYNDLRRLIVARAFYDGRTENHAITQSPDPDYQSFVKDIRSLQVNAGPKFLSALVDMISDANRWKVGTVIAGAPQGSGFRMILK